MSPRVRTGVLALQTALIVLLAWAAVYLGRDEFRLALDREDEELSAPSLLADEEAGALPEVLLNTTAQRLAGLELQLPTEATLPASSDLSATVVDPQPLLALRARLQADGQELMGAQAAAEASRLELARVQALFDDDRNASQRALEAARAQAQGDLARERRARLAVAADLDTARATWGPAVAAGLQAPDGGLLQRVWSGREVLLRVVLRADDLGPQPSQLLVDVPGRREPLTAQPLGVVAPAATQSPGAAETQAAGRHLLFRAPAGALVVGMRVPVRAAGGSKPQATPLGGLVPASAVIWHAGQAWIYLREGAAHRAARADADADADADEPVPSGAAAASAPAASAPAPQSVDRFQRRGVPDAVRVGEQWFVPGLDADEPVVVRGAQLLLSEELKSRIKNENDD